MRVAELHTHVYEINAAMNSFQMFGTITNFFKSLFEPLSHKPPINASMKSIQTGKEKSRISLFYFFIK